MNPSKNGLPDQGLNLFRQLVRGHNALRDLDVFACNGGEHEAGCECFWEQCERWAALDAAPPVDSPKEGECPGCAADHAGYHNQADRHDERCKAEHAVLLTCFKCGHSNGVDSNGWCLHNRPYDYNPATSLSTTSAKRRRG